MVRRFQPSMIQNPFELLLSLKQEGSVEAYVEEFEKYVGALQKINPGFVRGIFLNGLKEEIRVEVMLYELETLPEVIQKAILIEQKNVIVEKRSTEGYATTVGPYHSNTYNRIPILPVTTREGSSMKSVVVTSRNTQEATNSRSKTDYKRCDELFTRDHVCKNKQLRMILLVEEEDDENEVDVGEGLESFDSLQLSMYSMMGLTLTKSWKVGGTLWDNLAVILIDCRASRNFILRELVNILQLKVEETHAYVVEVEDGQNVRCKGKCAQLKLSMQQLEEMDLVLGLKWLARLGEVKADFGRTELTIKRVDSIITIAGDLALNRTKLSYGTFMQALLEERGELEGTLQQYQDVVQNTQGLPPSRRQDHAIHLKNEVKFWFNSNYNNSTRMSPFRTSYDREPPILLKATTIQDKFLDFPLEDKELASWKERRKIVGIG
ncbi:hypothetical protein Lal_00017316 [Lupinus albus]|nr:hypothetical protein Lal_00017316 [Lupinus albus]